MRLVNSHWKRQGSYLAKKPARPKAVNYIVIPETSETGRPMYELLYSLIDTNHEALSQTQVRVVLAWATSWKSDTDGRVTLGKCKRASDLDRELAPFDFVILLNREFWQNPLVTPMQRTALLDHELMHAAVAYDDRGEPKIDERGRTVYRVRKHDLEEFSDIAARYGCWKRDIEAFAQALSRAERSSAGWVGYTSLHETLKDVGYDVPAHTIASWPDDQRREVLTWALLRQSGVPQAAIGDTMPPCLTDAVAANSGLGV